MVAFPKMAGRWQAAFLPQSARSATDRDELINLFRIYQFQI